MAIDYVVDAQWDLVRFRAMLAEGDQVVAVPQRGGLNVIVSGLGAEAAETIPGATAVWSSSPCSLLLANRRLRSTGESSFKAVSLAPPFHREVVQVRLEARGAKRVNTPRGASVAEDVDLLLDDRRVNTLIRSDLPLFAEGWFELIG